MLHQIKNLFTKKKDSSGGEACTSGVGSGGKEAPRHRKNELPNYPGLEQYELKKKVGDGAFSNVYEACDRNTNRDVAIKVVRKCELETSKSGRNHLHPNMKKTTKATERANILKEVQIMRTIDHQNIVRLVQFTESDEYFYLVLELCHGGELFNRIVELTYLSEDLSRHVITQIGAGIRHLHEECGVVHRDIKPENILFEPIPVIPSEKPPNAFEEEGKVDEGKFQPGVGGGGIGRVKIADFGLSKIIWDNDTLTPCGTVGYTAPEIVRDQKYSKSVDMWAIGCVLYTMLCGFPPFYDESIKALTTKVAHGQYTFLSPWWDPISDAAKDLISHLLCVDPTKRYTIDEFFKHPWITQEAGISAAKEHKKETTYNTVYDSPLETPSRAAKRVDVFSPGAPTLKEIMDITYAVQRLGEEKGRSGVPSHLFGPMGGTIDEEDEDEEEEEDEDGDEDDLSRIPASDMPEERRIMAEQLAQDGRGVAGAAFNPSVKDGKRKETVSPATPLSSRRKHGFELNITNATLLKNRRGPAP